MRKDMLHKSLAVGLAVLMAVQMPPVQASGKAGAAEPEQAGEDSDAAGIGYEQIDIHTAEDLAAFAKECYIDSWSKDKYVSLKADIDLTGVAFEPVPVFAGIFDGEGHAITGFDHTGDGYVTGLFRYVERDGVIQDLTLKGTIGSENERECVGSICGINHGMIKDCTFQGNVSGRDTVGGIVGINEGPGMITGCTAKGRVTGYYSTGGIAGINHGTINGCTDHAGINDNNAWVEEDDEMGGIAVIESLASDAGPRLYSGVDTGGIAGFSDGMIIRCTNAGIVGYEHTGYNIGGIVGRQSGTVSLSTNQGTVYGRKDVGGIVGQMEPYIEVDEAESFRDAVNRLHALIDKTLDDMGRGKDAIKGDFDSMAAYSDAALVYGDALVGQMTDVVDVNIAQVQEITGRAEHVMDQLPGIFDHVSDAGDSLSRMESSLERAMGQLDITDRLDDSAYDGVGSKRVALLSTVGGNVLCDKISPSKGETVTITVLSDTGYGLTEIRAADADGNVVPCRDAGGGRYAFEMTEKNVRVYASFGYDGTTTISAASPPDPRQGIQGSTEKGTEAAPGEGTATGPGTEDEMEEDPEPGSMSDEDISEDQADGQARAGADSVPDAAAGDKAAPKQPVRVSLSSNFSGNASCRADNGIVTLRIKPDDGYVLKGAPKVTNATGLAFSGQQSGYHTYEFQIADSSEICYVTIEFGQHSQSKKEAVDAARDQIRTEMEVMQQVSEDIGQIVSRIKDNGAYSEADLIELSEKIGEMSHAASAILSDLGTISKIMGPYVSDAAKDLKKDLDDLTSHIQQAVDGLRAASDDMQGIVDYINAQEDIRFAQFGEGFGVTREALHHQLQGISDSLKSLNADASRYSDIINADLRAVNDQMNVVFNLLADRMTDAQQLDIDGLYEEIDEDRIELITTGKTDACRNRGVVKGDINVGGIAGSMDIDDEDLEGNAAGSLEYRIGRRFITQCLIVGSVNEGYVTAKKDGAGGICGYMGHGIIMGSEGYGSVESTEGSFVGGICGESLTMIKQCYAMCSVSGNKNVGGIAGQAEILRDCCSMASVEAVNGREGAIAGQVSSYEEVPFPGEDADDASGNRPKVSGNRYVSGADDDRHGIDGVSYVGAAEPVTYEELLTVEDLPTPFWHLKVIYMIEDIYLGSEEVPYGAALDRLAFPAIPEKEGYYGVWPDLSEKKMYGTIVVGAQYRENVTVVQSSTHMDIDGASEGSRRSMPYALIEDIFTEDTILNAVLSDQAPPQDIGDARYVVYDISLEGSDIGPSDTFALRIRAPYEDAVVYAYRDGRWSQIESRARGGYLQVEMAGAQEYFCVVEQKSDLPVIIVLAAAASAVLAVLVAVIRKMRAKMRSRSKVAQAKKEE